MLGLCCVDCGLIVFTIEDAEAHEIEASTLDEPHGGWDTARVGED